MIFQNEKKAEPSTKQHYRPSSGFTIIEVMIVLAISGGMLSAAALMISGQQERTRFSTNVREVENKLSDIFNDVETGYYTNSGAIECKVLSPLNAASAPEIQVVPPASAPAQGTNQDCLFLGMAISFYKASGSEANNSYRIFTLIGRRQTVDGTGNPALATTLAQARPQASEQLLTQGSFAAGVEITNVRFMKFPLDSRDNIAILAPLGSFSAQNHSLAASNGKPSLARLNFASSFLDIPANFVSTINAGGLSDASVNAASEGAVICLRSDGGRVAAVAVGVQLNASGAPEPFGQRLATQAYFDNEATSLGCPA